MRHPSAISDFTDRDEVDAVYEPDVMDFVRERTGADAVASRGSGLRRAVP